MTALSNEALFKKHDLLLGQYKTLQDDNAAHKIDKRLISFYQEMGKQDIHIILEIEKQACEYANREYSENATERSLNTVNALEFIGRGIHHVNDAKTPKNISRVIFGVMPVKPKEVITKKDVGSDNVNKAINNHVNFLSGISGVTLRKDGVSKARKQNMEAVRTYYTDKQLELVKKERSHQTRRKIY